MNRNFTKSEYQMFVESIENVQKYLSEHYNPHVKIIINSSSVEVFEGILSIIETSGDSDEAEK